MGKLYQEEYGVRHINPTTQHYSTDLALNIVKQGVVYDSDAIKQSITNIVLTYMGERLFNLEFGTNVYTMLFNIPNTQASIYAVKSHLISRVLAFETRISIFEDKSSVSFDPNSNELSVRLSFMINASAETDVWSNTLVF